ncbi:MAG: NADH-quinone oxidoreductase subunit M [Verrucomicrobia bacterium]|nr:NADH-quinone oxidoreductase subunit M [Verrucomicrobiota bacterium]
MSILAWTIYVSFLGALTVLLLPARGARAPHWAALGTTLLSLGMALAGAAAYSGGGHPTTIVRLDWIKPLGVQYHLAADGVSALLVVLTGIASVAGVLFSWNVEMRAREYFAFYLALLGGVYGVFLSFDLFLLFVFYEMAIVPKYFLIAIWGSTRREYAAMKLVLYSFVGSAAALVGLVAVHVQAAALLGRPTMDLELLSRLDFPVGFQVWAFPLMFVGFGVLAGLWPLHSWAPTGHVAAPTAASMLLAGVVMKLGAYGALRAGAALFPEGLQAWASWAAALGVIGILYGALVALAQRDFKFVIGFSSVSHMGFVILGLATWNVIGLSGAVVQMFSHGVLAGLLFAVVGRMVYDRTHTRDLDELEPMRLRKALPFAAGTFVVAGMASMGLPGFSGFVAELSILRGAWRAAPWAAVGAGIGIVLGAAYLLRVWHKAFYSDGGDAEGGLDAASALPPITWPEKAGAALLAAASLAVGLYPRIVFDLVTPSVKVILGQGGAL